MSFRHLATTIFDADKLKPKYLSLLLLQKSYSFYKNPEYSFKTNIHFLKKIQNIHSKQIFILLNHPEYSFKGPEYSFKKNIHFYRTRVRSLAMLVTN